MDSSVAIDQWYIQMLFFLRIFWPLEFFIKNRKENLSCEKVNDCIEKIEESCTKQKTEY